MADFTPGPWEAEPTGGGLERMIIGNAYTDEEGNRCGTVIAVVNGNRTSQRVMESNAKRIVSCVNFCDGTDSDYLDGSSLGRMIAASESVAELKRQRDELLAACRRLVASCEAVPTGLQPTHAQHIEQDAALYQARAALAKARGETEEGARS